MDIDWIRLELSDMCCSTGEATIRLVGPALSTHPVYSDT